MKALSSSDCGPRRSSITFSWSVSSSSVLEELSYCGHGEMLILEVPGNINRLAMADFVF